MDHCNASTDHRNASPVSCSGSMLSCKGSTHQSNDAANCRNDSDAKPTVFLDKISPDPKKLKLVGYDKNPFRLRFLKGFLIYKPIKALTLRNIKSIV